MWTERQFAFYLLKSKLKSEFLHDQKKNSPDFKQRFWKTSKVFYINVALSASKGVSADRVKISDQVHEAEDERPAGVSGYCVFVCGHTSLLYLWGMELTDKMEEELV